LITRRRGIIINFSLFLICLPRTSKSKEVFKLTSLCHIAVRVDAYKSQTCLMQCYNCQKFGYVWANCKQPPTFMWCEGGHLHKECPEEGNTSTIPTCCNPNLVDGGEPHPSSYRGCRHAKEEMRRRKLQRVAKTKTRRIFCAAAHSNSSSLSRFQLHRPLSPPLRHNQQVPSRFRLLLQTVRL
jgi:hypothetical protein